MINQVEMLEKHFNVTNSFTAVFSLKSNEYKYYKPLIEKYLSSGNIDFISKSQHKITYKLNICYSQKIGIKKHCYVQCDACRTLQKTKESINIKVYENRQIIEVKKEKNPSKIQQIIKILFK